MRAASQSAEGPAEKRRHTVGAMFSRSFHQDSVEEEDPTKLLVKALNENPYLKVSADWPLACSLAAGRALSTLRVDCNDGRSRPWSASPVGEIGLRIEIVEYLGRSVVTANR